MDDGPVAGDERARVQIVPLTAARADQAGADNLPAQLTSFVGRQREVAEVRRLLAQARLLTLTGAGGVGKTRLALEAAGGVLDGYPDGVWLVELAALRSPALVPRAVASVLRVPRRPGRRIADALADFLRSKRLLLVLDNCEHVVAACRTLVEVLLRASPTLRVLATSREALHVPGEVLYRVPPLSLPTGIGSSSGEPEHPTLGRPKGGRGGAVAAVLRSEAGQLFQERAFAVRADLRVTDQNAHAVAEICRRLDGIPLAVELAAARTGVLTPQQIAERLGDRFRLLGGGAPSAIPSQRTLLASLDWSYDLLTGDQQLVLRRMSAFVGSCTFDAAEAVCGVGDRILELLSDLVDASLVIADTTGDGARYRLLETIREYAALQLVATGEEESARQSHRDWFLTVAERAAPELEGPRQAYWLDRLEMEHEDLRAALRWCVERREAEPGLRLGRALFRLWLVRDHPAEGYAWLQRLLELGEGQVSTLRADVLHAAGRLAHLQGDAEASERYQRASLEMATALEYQIGRAGALARLGRLARDRGDWAAARGFYAESAGIWRALGEPRRLGVALAGLGRTAMLQGDVAEAGALVAEALGIHRELGHHVDAGTALICLGDIAAGRDAVDDAHARYTDALAIGRDVGDRTLTFQAIEGLAELMVSTAPWRALQLVGAAAALRDTIGLPPNYGKRPRLSAALASIRKELGDQKTDALLAQGRGMTVERAIDEALATPTDGAASPQPDALLTKRECDVAALIARGLTNRQIAAELVISELTAATHVRNILGKLGFEHRAQVAAWAVQQGMRAARAD